MPTVNVGVALATSFAGISISVVPCVGSLPSSWALPFPVVAVVGKSLFVNTTFPSATVFSPVTPGNVTFAPSDTPPPTVTSTVPVFGSCLPTVNVGVALATSFAGIFLSSLVSAGSFVFSVTVTFPVCTVSFS